MSDQIGNATKSRIYGFIIDNLLATILGFVIVAVVKPQQRPDKIINLGARVIHVYMDMKIIYVDGRVSDVQL